MSDTGPGWTEDQWERIRRIVHDTALRARVAASFLPLYGPLPAATETVPANRLSTDGPRLQVDDHNVIRIARVSVNVLLKNHMAADPELAAASAMFQRAAQIAARVEDAVIFRGRPESGVLAGAAEVPKVYSVGGAEGHKGLVELGQTFKADAAGPASAHHGIRVFQEVVRNITRLESHGYLRPYACILGNGLFNAVNTPIDESMVLPRDSIPPYLEGGPLLRSSCLDENQGLVVSLLGDPVEIVVPSDISVRYLQATPDGEHLFRVSQRFALRVKEPGAIAVFEVP